MIDVSRYNVDGLHYLYTGSFNVHDQHYEDSYYKEPNDENDELNPRWFTNVVL